MNNESSTHENISREKLVRRLDRRDFLHGELKTSPLDARLWPWPPERNEHPDSQPR